MPLLGQGSGVMWLWLVLASVSGWLVLQSRFCRHRIWPVTGYNRYFLILLVGILTTVAVTVVVAAVTMVVAVFRWLFAWSPELPASLSEIWKFSLRTLSSSERSSDSIWLVLFWSAPASLVAGLLVQLFSLRVDKETVIKRRLAYLTEINGIQSFVEEAGERGGLVALTLSNRKVYIGWPEYISDADNPRPPNQHLYFSPLFSGYRKKGSLEMEIPNNYSKLINHYTTEEWEMVIPVNEIVHAQPFDLKVHRKIKLAKHARKSGSRKKLRKK